MNWVRVCGWDDLEPERAVAALVAGDQVAVVRLADGTVHAVSHRDPVSGANVMARGIVGSAAVGGVEVPTLTSPMYKERYDLTTGHGVGAETSLRVWGVRVVGGWVEVSSAEAERGAA